MFRNRSVTELMVMTFTALVSFMMIVGWLLLFIVEIRDPEVDTQTLTQSLTNLTAGILGALLGLLAGKSVSKDEFGVRPDGTLNGLQETSEGA